ncbi:MAG TPA: hypothetical protein VGB95_05500 [Chitinophagales bacterium]
MKFLVTIFAVCVFTFSYSQQIEKGKYRVRLSGCAGLFLNFKGNDTCEVFYHDDTDTHLEAKGTYKVRGSYAIIDITRNDNRTFFRKYLLTFSDRKWWLRLNGSKTEKREMQKFEW